MKKHFIGASIGKFWRLIIFYSSKNYDTPKPLIKIHPCSHIQSNGEGLARYRFIPPLLFFFGSSGNWELGLGRWGQGGLMGSWRKTSGKSGEGGKI